jgi:hypothetical protein
MFCSETPLNSIGGGSSFYQAGLNKIGGANKSYFEQDITLSELSNLLASRADSRNIRKSLGIANSVEASAVGLKPIDFSNGSQNSSASQKTTTIFPQATRLQIILGSSHWLEPGRLTMWTFLMT